MKPGESVFDATRRLLQREVKLDMSVEDLKRRLLTVGSYSFVWGPFCCASYRIALHRSCANMHVRVDVLVVAGLALALTALPATFALSFV